GLERTRLSGSGLVYLREMTKLVKLDLEESFLTDLGLEKLKGPPLTSLNAEGTFVTDKGVKQLTGIAGSLRTLNLAYSGVTDACLTDLGSLKLLETLRLDGTAVTGDKLDQLAGCAGLRSLSLANTALTDAGLAKLPALPELATLQLEDNAV